MPNIQRKYISRKINDNWDSENKRIEDVASPLNDGDAVNKGFLSNFGLMTSYQSNELISCTTSIVYQDKINYVTNVLPIGKYRVAFYAEGKISNSSHEYMISGIIDDVGVFATSGNDVGNNNVWKDCSGFVQVEFITEISHIIKLQWKSSHTKKTASIRRARIELWRIL